MRENWIYRRGDIYLANLGTYVGCEQGGTRPVVVLQNNAGNYFCPTLIVAPITSRPKKLELPTHYFSEYIPGLRSPATVLLEQILTIDKCRIQKYVGKVFKRQMAEIDTLIEVSLGLFITEDTEAP